MRAHIFSDTRRTNAWVLPASLAVLVAGTFPLYFSSTYRQGLLLPIQEATKGLCNATLVHGLIGIALSVGVVVFGLGRLRPRDLGIRLSGFASAVRWTVCWWLLLQGLSVIAALLQGGTITLHDQWSTLGVPRTLGLFIGQLFGNALYEEIMFRGLLIAQLYLLLERALPQKPKTRMAWSLIVSQTTFALTHIPNRLAQGAYENLSGILADQAVLVLVGLLFAWLFLRTGNLLIAVGAHALFNYPPMLFASPLGREGWKQGTVLGILVLTLLIWTLLARLRKRLNTDSPSAAH